MENLNKKEGKAPSDKVKGAKKKACRGDCPSPTLCKDVFQGDCALEIMSQQEAEKGEKPGTKGYASKGK
tara:strand:+ start:1239 stop:1445 length:207 start_codon:yes stop_codon:yes gene_type:complete